MNFNHLPLTTEDGTQVNLDVLYKIAPSCFTEARDEKTGALRHVVDFKKLRQLLGDNAVEDEPEAYEFTWVGKQAARREAATPINKTLRPVPESSVDWENTQNIYIEGDNLDALKLLQKSYLGKIKIMYFDPPYNTGSDFVYHDNFKQSQDEYSEEAGYVDELGNRFVKNTDSNGRFHSDWCSMIYPRLQIAHSLLCDNGIIFASIGEKELSNIIKCFDEVFGEINEIGVVPRVMKSGGGKGQFFSPNIDYVIIYAKNIDLAGSFREPISEDIIKRLYTSVEKEGNRKGEHYRPFGLYQSSLDPLRGCTNQRYYIEAPDGTLLIPPGNSMPKEPVDGAQVTPKTSDDKVWRWSRERYQEEKEKGNIEFKKSDGVLIDSNGKPAKWNVYTKIWLNDRQDSGMTPVNFITKYENRQSAKELKELDIPFDFAKPVGLIKYLISLVPNNEESIVLDFFSGSASTAHAVLQLNSEDNGKRKFIMIQLPEKIEENDPAYKKGFKTICELGEERIRRAGKKIQDELKAKLPDLFENGNKSQLDTGFRVFRVDSSNMKDVYFAPKDLDPQQLDLFADNVKEDRTELDLLYGCMVDWGVQLSLPLATETIDGVTVYTINDGDLVACFGKPITDNVVKAMADKAPLRVLFRDSCFEKDEQKINIFEQFKQLLSWSDDEALNNIRVI